MTFSIFELYFIFAIVCILILHYTAPEFYKVKLTDGTEGFVKAEFCRSQIDYRLGIAKENNEWKINFLVKGD